MTAPKPEARPFEPSAGAYGREHAAIYAGVGVRVIDEARAGGRLTATSPNTRPMYTRENLDKWISEWPVMPKPTS